MLKFTRGVRQEVDLLRYLNWYCSDQSPGAFVFAGDGCDAADDADDAHYARETYARFDDDAFDFLLSVGVRDLTLRCVRINVISSLNEFDALRIEDAYVEDLSITASRIANVSIANVIGDGRIELDDTVVSGAVVLRLVYGSPSLSLLRSTIPDLQVSDAELGAIDLTSASLGSVSFDALRADTISFRQADISEAVRLGDVDVCAERLLQRGPFRRIDEDLRSAHRNRGAHRRPAEREFSISPMRRSRTGSPSRMR